MKLTYGNNFIGKIPELLAHANGIFPVQAAQVSTNNTIGGGMLLALHDVISLAHKSGYIYQKPKQLN